MKYFKRGKCSLSLSICRPSLSLTVVFDVRIFVIDVDVIVCIECYTYFLLLLMYLCLSDTITKNLITYLGYHGKH